MMGHTILYENSKKNKLLKLPALNSYIKQYAIQLSKRDSVPAIYENESVIYAIDSMKKARLRDSLAHNRKFKKLLAEALAEVKQKNIITDDEFEDYVATYISKAEALELKRNRKVIGGCSMDQSPRYHALNIAKLSAEAVNWQVFLRAHLNIMNDRFERMTDGSYAWGQRKTYIKELEELNIDVLDLLLGISLSIENPVEKHYHGSINRLGRALAETKNRVQFEEKVLSMIKDNELDAYNRMLMHYLFLNYVYYLPERNVRMEDLAKLEEADKTLPFFISSRIKINKKNFEDREE